MVRAALAALLCVACQGQPSGGTETGRSGSAAKVARDAAPARDAVEIPEDAPPRPDEPEIPDPGRAIAELGAIPAWQAVVDRAQLLARRGQHGAVYGRVGPALLVPAPPPAATGDAGVPVDAGLVASPYVWLIDDTEGNGSLGIRIELGGRAREGERIAAGGAWQLDADRRWFWKPDVVHRIPPGPVSGLKDPPAPEPSHNIAYGELPAGARPISLARDNDAVYFQVVGPPPTTDGDGWQIADELGDPPVAVLNLPGERPSYGGHDMRAADERWSLRRGQTYWVRIGKVRRRAPDKPAQVNARTAPIRVL